MKNENSRSERSPYEIQLLEAVSQQAVSGGQPVAIDLVAQSLALVSAGDRDKEDMAQIGRAMKSVAQSCAIPAEEMKRYLEAAAVGQEWEPEKVQVLLDYISGE